MLVQIIKTSYSSFYSNHLKELKEFLNFSIQESNFMIQKEIFKCILKINCKEVTLKAQKEIKKLIFSCLKDKKLIIINEFKINRSKLFNQV